MNIPHDLFQTGFIVVTYPDVLGGTQFDKSMPWKCPMHWRSRALASTFLEVGETYRPRFPPVYSAILGACYSCLHFSAPLSPFWYFLLLNAATFVSLFVHSSVCRSFFLPCALCPYNLSWKYVKVTLTCSDTFGQLLRDPMLLIIGGSDSLTYLKKPWCNPLLN